MGFSVFLRGHGQIFSGGLHSRLRLHPLACGYNGAIAVDTWRKLMDVLEIPAWAQEQVLRLAVRAICIGFSTMVDIRYGCFSASDQSGQSG